MSVSQSSRLGRIARVTGKILAGLVALVLLFVLGVVIINFYDPPLSDQAKALLLAPPNPYPADDNLYLAIAGMEGPSEGPEGRSITAMGQERIETYNQALDSMLRNPALLKVDDKWTSTKLAYSGELGLGPTRSTSIWMDAKSHRDGIAAALASNQILYQRYLALHRLHGYYETARPSYLAPMVYVPTQLRILYLADLANRMQTGNALQQREALNDLQQDLQMWKAVLQGEGTLVGKMLAASSLHADLILLADFIDDPNSDLASLDDVLDPMLLPFDLKDLRIGNAFPAEFRGTAVLFKSLANYPNAASTPSDTQNGISSAFQVHFFKLNATENMSAANATQWTALADSAPGQFLQNREATRAWVKQNAPNPSPWSLYNPVGKFLVALAISQSDSYPLRVYDVAAYQRLVLLVFQLKRQHIAPADVASFLVAHPEWSTHPVDGKPFSWNAQSGELAINTLAENSKQRRFSVVLK
jgi:hypothetical protein